MERGAEEEHDGHLSLIGMLQQVCGDREPRRAVAYFDREHRGRTEALRGAGFDTVIALPDRARRLVQIAIDAVVMAPRADAVVLATSDPALVPVAEYLRTQGVRVELATFVPAEFKDLATPGLVVVELGEESVFTP